MNQTHTSSETSTSAIRTIAKNELQKKIWDGSVQVVNVLDPKYYHLGFIQGSIKIPLAQLDEKLGELDKTREVVTYCAGYECSASKKAAQKLAAKGYKVSAYEGGIKEWKEAGLPTTEAGLPSKKDAGSETGSSACCA